MKTMRTPSATTVRDHGRPEPASPMRGFFDVHPDGERIVIRKPAARQQRQENPVFVFNFFEELRSKAR
jgi:hypothetical protein